MRARGGVGVLVVALTIWCQSAFAERTAWPGGMDLSLSFASRKNARIVLAGEAYGTFKRTLTLKAGGWIANGSEGTKGFLANAYVGMDRPNYYIAAGQKFVVFGPAGLLVSPGARGAEVVLKGRPLTLQLLAGRTQFTPPTGTAGRFTPNTDPLFGERRLHRQMTAVRVEYDLPRAAQHTYLGLNGLWTDSRGGASIDLESPAGAGKSFYAEVASFDGTTAQLGGVRFREFGRYLSTSRPTTLDIFWRNLPEDYLPAQVGATQYYPRNGGVAAGFHHQLSALSAVGLYGDGRGVMMNFFRNFYIGQ